MKKFLYALITATLCLTTDALANETTVVDVTQYGIETLLSDPCGCTLKKPFGILLDGSYIAKAPVCGNHDQHIHYADGQVEGLYGVKLSENSAAFVNVGAGFDRIKWDQNPYFVKEYFPCVNVGISGYTTSVRNWIWMAGINCQYDTNAGIVHRFTRASRYGALLWGRYTYDKCLGLHLGVLIFTGIRKTNAYPIIGFDYTLSSKWKINGIFPLNMAVIYSFTDVWSLSFAGRPFIARHRLSSNQPIQNGIFEYRNYGAELSLNFDKCGLFWQLYAGYSFGGTLKTEDSNGNEIAYTRYDGAPYVGANILWRF
ncbi:MAG: hypothetical protein P4L16_04870 [Chlamydiales bacterium]|nr:hypothetical protein [Chlamydiales bacterium]